MRACRLSAPWKAARPCASSCATRACVLRQPVGGIEEDRLGAHVGRRPLMLEQRQADVEAATGVGVRGRPAVDDGERAQALGPALRPGRGPTRPPSAWPTKWAGPCRLASSTASRLVGHGGDAVVGRQLAAGCGRCRPGRRRRRDSAGAGRRAAAPSSRRCRPVPTTAARSRRPGRALSWTSKTVSVTCRYGRSLRSRPALPSSPARTGCSSAPACRPGKYLA